MKFLGTKTLESARLILRKARMTDANDGFNNWVSRLEVTKFLNWDPYTNIEDYKKFLAMIINRYNDPKYMDWVIYYKETDSVIGSIGIMNVDESLKTGSIGYCLSNNYWNKGIMSEALEMVLYYAFLKLDFFSIEAIHDVNNPASGKVMIKNGLKLMKIEKQFSKKANSDITMNRYRITKEEWLKWKNSKKS